MFRCQCGDRHLGLSLKSRGFEMAKEVHAFKEEQKSLD